MRNLSIKKTYKYCIVTALLLAMFGIGACSDRDKTANVVNKDDKSGGGGGGGGGGGSYKPSPEMGYGTGGYGRIWVLATGEITRYIDIALKGEKSTRVIPCEKVSVQEKGWQKTIAVNHRDCRDLKFVGNETILTEFDNNGLKSIRVNRARYSLTPRSRKDASSTRVEMSMELIRQGSGSLNGVFNFEAEWISARSAQAATLDITNVTIPAEAHIRGLDYTVDIGNFTVEGLETRNGDVFAETLSQVSPEQINGVDEYCGHIHSVANITQKGKRQNKDIDAQFKLSFFKNEFKVVGKDVRFTFSCPRQTINRASMLTDAISGITGQRIRDQNEPRPNRRNQDRTDDE